MRTMLAVSLAAACLSLACSGADPVGLPGGEDAGADTAPLRDAGVVIGSGSRDASADAATIAVPDAATVDSCHPSTSCASANADCGAVDDGCGHALNCGTCASPTTCGGGGFANRCGCQPAACQAGECGTVQTACGDKQCGQCGSKQTCGGGGVANKCGNFFDACSGAPDMLGYTCVIDMSPGAPPNPKWCDTNVVQANYAMYNCQMASSSLCGPGVGCYF